MYVARPIYIHVLLLYHAGSESFVMGCIVWRYVTYGNEPPPILRCAVWFFVVHHMFDKTPQKPNNSSVLQFFGLQPDATFCGKLLCKLHPPNMTKY